MKQVIFTVLISVFLSGCASTSKERSPESKENWRLVWTENFNGNTFDEKVWSKIPRGGSDWNRHMSSYDSLYAVEKGHLILRGVNNHTQKSDTAKFLTGGLYTKGKKTFGLGRVEIRAKLGSARGYWPAFWMLPATAKWPSGGEIDIMEHLNSEGVIYQTLHSNYTYKLGIKRPKPGAVTRYDHGDYNIYGVEKYQDSICFFLNGVKTLTYPRLPEHADKGQFPFCDEPYYLILDSQLGGNWVGKIYSEDLPVEMYIDWVKFYEKR